MRSYLPPGYQADLEGYPLTKYYDRYAQAPPRQYRKRDIELKTPDLDILTEQE